MRSLWLRWTLTASAGRRRQEAYSQTLRVVGDGQYNRSYFSVRYDIAALRSMTLCWFNRRRCGSVSTVGCTLRREIQ